MSEVLYKIRVNRPCRLFIDDAEIMTLEQSKIVQISLPEGEYIRKVVAVDNSKVFNESIITLIKYARVEDIHLDTSDMDLIKYKALLKGEFIAGDLVYKYLNDNNVSVVKNINKELEELIIPSQICVGDDSYNVTEIGEEAFMYCHSIKSVKIPDSVKVLRNSAFHNCNGLTHIDIPNNVIQIGDGVFSVCGLLKSITLGKSVSTIGRGAFSSTRLENLIFPEGVKQIGLAVFEACTDLISIAIPRTVERIERLTGYNNPCSISSIVYGGTKEQWAQLDKDIHWKMNTKLKVIHCLDGDIEL